MKHLLNIAKRGILGLLGTIALLTIWGLIEPKTLNVEQETAQIPNLPGAWEGQKIAQLSDLQIGMWWGNPGTARRAVAKTIEAKPAAVLISGDFLYHAEPAPQAEIDEVVAIVHPLVDAGLPTYAVLGNHDYGMSERDAEPAEKLASRLETSLVEAGIVVLKNESTAIAMASQKAAADSSANQPLYLVAVNSRWANRDKVKATLAGIPDQAPRIALMHNPESFELFPAQAAPLALAGHTHGGQMRIPGFPQWSWLRFVHKDDVYADGWAKGYGEPGNHLYVSPGIGMSIVPMRIFCPPELTFFTLEG